MHGHDASPYSFPSHGLGGSIIADDQAGAVGVGGDPSATAPDSAAPTSAYKRYGRKKRAAGTKKFERKNPRQETLSLQSLIPADFPSFSQMGIDFTELVFAFLSVESQECRKRFTCEVDFMARRDPFVQIGFRVMG